MIYLEKHNLRICEVGTGSLPVVPHVTGGVEKFVHYLSSALCELGHEVTLLDMPYAYRPKVSYDLKEVPLIFKNYGNLPVRVLHGLSFGYSVRGQLGKLIRHERYGVINFHDQFTASFGMQLAKRMRLPSVFTLHNPLWSDVSSCRSALNKLKFLIERKVEKNIDLLICLSQTVAANVTSFLGVDRSKVSVVPIGVDDSWFIMPRIDPSIRRKYAPNDEFVVLHVGRIASYKNQLVIARAIPNVVREFQNVKFVFVGPVGSPSYFRMVMRTLKNVGAKNHVVFAGQVPFSELRQLYYLADVFVLPSLQENMPQALLEAMAAGRPLISSSIASLKEHLPNGKSILISPSDHKALAMAIIKLLRNPYLRDILGQRARLHAYRCYRWPMIAQQTVDLFSDLMAK